MPLYILTLARPELLDRRSDWGAGHRNFSSLHLDALEPDEMRELLTGLIPGLPEAAIRAVVTRAEGIPLYAVETVRMLVAEGRLEPIGDGTFRPTGDLATLAIPETLTSLIAARLDSLDPADRALILDAAVLGQSFTVPGLAAVSGQPEEASPTDRYNLVGTILELRAYRGLPVEEQIEELTHLHATTEDPQLKSSLPTALATEAWMAGRLEEARQHLHRVIEINVSAAAQAYPLAARLALWQRDVDGARADLAARDASGLYGGAMDAERSAIQAGIAALEGRSREAIVLYREAMRGWQELGLPWDEALTAIDMAMLLDPAGHDVEAAAAAAAQTLERLGAKPMQERLGAALQRREAVPG